MKLDPDLDYLVKPFASPSSPEVPESVSVHDPKTMRIGDEVHFENPFSGHCEGMVMGAFFERVPSDGDVAKEGGGSKHGSSRRETARVMSCRVLVD